MKEQTKLADNGDGVTTEQAGARELLLETASQIMREGDQVDISLSELSLRSGLNSALVKYYFGNKAGMLGELLDRDMVAIIKSVGALLAKDHMSPEAKLRQHIARWPRNRTSRAASIPIMRSPISTAC